MDPRVNKEIMGKRNHQERWGDMVIQNVTRWSTWEKCLSKKLVIGTIPRMTRIGWENHTKRNYREVSHGRDHWDLLKVHGKGGVDKQIFRELLLQVCQVPQKVGAGIITDDSQIWNWSLCNPLLPPLTSNFLENKLSGDKLLQVLIIDCWAWNWYFPEVVTSMWLENPEAWKWDCCTRESAGFNYY